MSYKCHSLKVCSYRKNIIGARLMESCEISFFFCQVKFKISLNLLCKKNNPKGRGVTLYIAKKKIDQISIHLSFSLPHSLTETGVTDIFIALSHHSFLCYELNTFFIFIKNIEIQGTFILLTDTIIFFSV